MADMKTVYQAATQERAEENLDMPEEKMGWEVSILRSILEE